jgi:hypothetical protein
LKALFAPSEANVNNTNAAYNVGLGLGDAFNRDERLSSISIQPAIPRIVKRAGSVLPDWGLGSGHKQVPEERIAILERQIADLKKRWPAHSISPALMQQLDELEMELEIERKKLAHKKRRKI